MAYAFCWALTIWFSVISQVRSQAKKSRNIIHEASHLKVPSPKSTAKVQRHSPRITSRKGQSLMTKESDE